MKGIFKQATQISSIEILDRQPMGVFMVKKTSILVVFTILVVGLPLIGVYLSGRSALLFVSFPPLARPAGHEPFSWLVFMAYLFLEIGTLCVFGVVARGSLPKSDLAIPPVKGGFPWWGWLASGVLLISWFLAWTRMPWFGFFQRHTFIPLWFSYIVVVNAMCFRQSGSCPLLNKPIFFLALFPVSSVFWWYFEYLNQFAHSWYYTGVDYGPIPYSIHATISFCTVLPAIYTTRTLISDMKWFRPRFFGLPPVWKSESIVFVSAILLVGCSGLIGVTLWPDKLFSMLWIAPLLILTSLQRITGQTSIFSAMADGGDWRPVLSAAIAALICGFFWEMWNYYSLAKWMYSIPYIYRFKIFEMPILGYMGYLPFGLECIAIAEFFEVRYINCKN